MIYKWEFLFIIEQNPAGQNVQLLQFLVGQLLSLVGQCPMSDRYFEACTSKVCGENNKSFDVNRRIVYTMRSCGQGYAGLENFTSFMNMPKPMTQNNFDKIVKTVSHCAKAVAREIMNDAAEEIRKSDPSIVYTGVSVDGSWQRRGFSSLNGVVTAISMDPGKVLDCEPMSRFCRACNSKSSSRKTNPQAFEIWKVSHNCRLNYHGSAPGMEVTGTSRIFS